MKQFMLAAAFFLLLSCSGNKIPDGVLPRDKMIDVLIDIHLAEAAITTQQIYGETANQKAADYYDWIFKKHDVTREEFRFSFDFYSARPEIYKEIYEEMIIKMSRQEPEIKKSIKENIQPMIDSAVSQPDSVSVKHIDTLRQKINVNRPIHIPGRRN